MSFNLPSCFPKCADELKALEKTLAGFHKDHYIRQSLIDKIAILKVKVETERAELADTRTLEEKLAFEKKLEAGYERGHPILASGRFNTIAILEEQIKKNERLN